MCSPWCQVRTGNKRKIELLSPFYYNVRRQPIGVPNEGSDAQVCTFGIKADHGVTVRPLIDPSGHFDSNRQP